MRANIIATPRNLSLKTYFLQRNELIVITKYICVNTTHISQPLINLVAITYTYYLGKIKLTTTIDG
jgi:hypothetical protein